MEELTTALESEVCRIAHQLNSGHMADHVLDYVLPNDEVDKFSITNGSPKPLANLVDKARIGTFG